ncbi:MAG: bifunctional (p)ppGpp synthetase/guanosine-3',5'-bis(diphosphate) 3'-pyrophosphohydrolase, partial [Oscillospiraceae bacterium]|nr:bifunctional (p)ppGpp synthetase/guanosine-3',5'-bis(diphosphate) 3'-pyrophosphohydrolase [Oscillospiraceae bacterium]
MPDTAVIERKMDLGIENFDDFTDPDELYKELIARVRKYHPSDDISVIEQAYKLALAAHKDQKRKSGEPYIIHPLSVAIILADLEMDKETIVAGILHDIVEDTEISIQEVEARFGHETAALVDGVTKLGELKYQVDKVEEQAENLRKMFLAMAKDIRVIIVKLADRLHNMRTLKYMTREKQKEKAEETLDIYAPIAQRLGISAMKVELDDLSLKYLDPEIYYKLVAEINEKREERQQYVDMIVTRISKNMEDAGIEATVKGRAKHFFSIYRKMVNQNKSIDQIYDLMAVRILVDSVKDCYAALGILHELYTPVPGRFKDYIAMPKPNMYQSLHNTLIGPTGKPFEVQIRTYDMHRIAEYGIAAHWKYKEASDGKRSGPEQEEEKLNWLRQILEWQQDMSDNREFMSLLKSDLNLFNENVYCFSPAGDVKTLPAGSCTIDFAYAIHSAVGNRMVGARINGKLVPIETEIHNGDRVEIITSQNSRGPSHDWLKVVKSTQAKNRINRWFRMEKKEDNIVKGRDMLASYAHSKGRSLSDLLKPEYTDKVMQKYGFA